MSYKILVINPGSTSTKIGVFSDEELVYEKTLRHSVEEVGAYPNVASQRDFRKEIILKTLEEAGVELSSLHAIVGRGGLLKAIKGGTYSVNDDMLEDLRIGVQGEHASNLGGILADEIAKALNIPAFIVDPVVVDEFEDIARVSGIKELERRSVFHALNQKAVARRYAKETGKAYEDLNLIVAHLGGGISVGAHKKSQVIDCNNALDGDGPFSPERSGGLPVGDLVSLCYSGKYSLEEVKKFIVGKGGLVSYLNSNNSKDISERAARGEEPARLIYQAMSYQVAKEIGAMASVLKGQVDQIILTGGIAYDESFTDYIKDMVSYIADITVYPGEDELLALAEGGLRVLRKEEEAKIY